MHLGAARGRHVGHAAALAAAIRGWRTGQRCAAGCLGPDSDGVYQNLDGCVRKDFNDVIGCVLKLPLGANGRQAPAAASVYYKPTRRINPPDGLAKAPRLWASHAATTACARRTTRGH